MKKMHFERDFMFETKESSQIRSQNLVQTQQTSPNFLLLEQRIIAETFPVADWE